MAILFRAPEQNFVSTTLNGSINDTDTTITLTSTSNLQAPGYIVIDREDGSGNATPNAREVVYFEGISGDDLTSCTRGADGSTARSHSDGALVETTVTVGTFNSLASIVDMGLDNDGYLRPIASPVSISYAELEQAAIPSVASITEVQADRYVGMSGHFYWSRTGALATVLNATAGDTHFALQRATKNLSLVTTYISLLSAPSLAPLEIDISWASGPTGDFTSIYSTRPFVDIGEPTLESSATPGVLNLTSLASGIHLRTEIRKHGDAGGLAIQLQAEERV